MVKKKIIFGFAFILLILSPGLWAGDTATFVDLGFSPDGNTFMFAQYGVRSGNLIPWADLYLVDVPRNNFVNGGRINYVHNSPITAGNDGSSALYRALAQNTTIVQRHDVNHNIQGKPLFIALEDRPPGEAIEFRDFENNSAYRATVVSTIEGSGEGLRSSFFINLEKTQGSTRSNYTVGSPSIRRPLIESYRIRRVLVSPRGDSMIMVIEMRQREGENFNIRYMVEAVRL